MDPSLFDPHVLTVCLSLFLVVCVCCVALLEMKRHIVLFLWPVTIYFCGPLITSVFGQSQTLGNYVFMESIVPETVIMFAYFISFVIIDYFWDLSSAVRFCFSGPVLGEIARSPLFLLVYVTAGVTAACLQMVMLAQFGTVFSGAYVASGYEQGIIPFWGFLAGLYELIFFCFIIFLLGGKRPRLKAFMIGLYVVTAALRVAGGTRLILIKELAVICTLLYLQGSIRRSRLVMVAASIVVLGSVIGFLRSNGDIGNNIFGPLYGLAMESGLNALTFNVAYHVQETGYVSEHADLPDTLEFVALSAIPTFLRFGINQASLDRISPYGQAHDQFDTESPVGGMSGFATICYLSSNPLIVTLALVLVLSALLKLTPFGPTKQIVVVVMSISAIHFWRDPLDIAVKNVVQDVVCALTMLYFPVVWKELKILSSRHAVQNAGEQRQ